MIKFNKTSKIVMLISLLSFLFISCSTSIEGIETVRLETADEVIEKFNEYNLENNIVEMVKLYSDAYIDSTGTTLNYISESLSKNRNNIEITKSELIEIEDINKYIKKATLEISAVINGEELTEQYVYAVIKEYDGWSISPDGVIACKNYDAGIYEKDKLNLALGKEIELLDSSMVRISVLNNSDLNYTFGTEENKCEIIVETTSETVRTTMDKPEIVNEGLNSYFLSRVDLTTGEITKVTVTNIYEIDENLDPIENTKKDIVAYIK